MLSQMQAVAIVPSLTALLEHPEFQQGLANAHEQFLDEYEPAPLTEGQMVDEVEANLSHHVIKHDRIICARHECEFSYFYNLGYVFGIINEGLTCASPPC